MRRVLAAVFVLLSFCSPLFSRKNSDWAKVEKLKRGTPVWVELWKGVTLSGGFQSADASGLRLVLKYPWDGRPVEDVSRTDIRRVIHVRHPFLPDPHKWLLGGAMIGGAVGMGIGAVRDARGDPGPNWAVDGLAGAGLGFFGACASGAGIGVVALFHHNRVVYEDTKASSYAYDSGNALSSGETRPDLHGD